MNKYVSSVVHHFILNPNELFVSKGLGKRRFFVQSFGPTKVPRAKFGGYWGDFFRMWDIAKCPGFINLYMSDKLAIVPENTSEKNAFFGEI